MRLTQKRRPPQAQGQTGTQSAELEHMPGPLQALAHVASD